jgi:hypothetical protein
MQLLRAQKATDFSQWGGHSRPPLLKLILVGGYEVDLGADLRPTLHDEQEQ